MRSGFLFFWFCLSLSGHVFAQTGSVLWKIEGSNLPKPSYLFGTVNFLPKDAFSIPPQVNSALDSCEVFVTKILLNKKTQNQFNEAVRIPNNGWINDYLTDDELNQVRLLLLLDYEVKENMYYDFYSRLQPIMLVTLTAALELGDNITYPEKEMEILARKNNMNFVGLSTIEEEIMPFEQFPIKDQVEALKYTVNNFYQHLIDYKKMAEAYLEAQDLEKVKEETFKATNESQAFKKVYYDDRTMAWLPEVERLIQSVPTFIAVEVPHLVGDEGLIRLLKKKGYTVSPVSVVF